MRGGGGVMLENGVWFRLSCQSTWWLLFSFVFPKKTIRMYVGKDIKSVVSDSSAYYLTDNI